MNISWSFHTFAQLSIDELYSVLMLRQEVFVVEQNCAYLDCDSHDQDSHHLLGWLTSGYEKELVAYLRIIPPTTPDTHPHIGRVLCHKKIRRHGIGKLLIQRGISHCLQLFSGKQIHISAQQYLLGFYTDLGFQASSPPYDEDGIPHIGMIYEKDTKEPK
ncbi:GNAT family N-acetyltransferase [Desulforhopalus sp. IMCC35007]|uniref:GNAT family N-acetyltransferase n=1 Tax=Desulforhopalus sp. IMCC35007 TaxID=2569543 RepID=UPI0010AE0361|nr:GNAT family N-acetyltransferase [Desulforhopalus sp. IMCC35007]TKB11734.1 GNAT family N-acetyltransferase [Desulforhopalus sp. IMCC35007]